MNKRIASPPEKLKAQMAAGGVLALGVTDPFTALLAERAGAAVLYASGFTAEAVVLGQPDMGLITLPEMLGFASSIADRVDLPVVSDADVGFEGGPLNVHRTVEQFERRGIAAIHIEDQSVPKQCPFLPDGKTVLEREDARNRIRAAVNARDEMLIIARTDADYLGLDEVIDRCHMFLDAGADAVMPVVMQLNGVSVASLPPAEQMDLHRELNDRIDGTTVSLGFLPPTGYTVADFFDAGYALVPAAVDVLEASVNAALSTIEALVNHGSTESVKGTNPPRLRAGLDMLQALGIERLLEIQDQATGTNSAEAAKRVLAAR
jgi:methylisocitrate lyase